MPKKSNQSRDSSCQEDVGHLEQVHEVDDKSGLKMVESVKNDASKAGSSSNADQDLEVVVNEGQSSEIESSKKRKRMSDEQKDAKKTVSSYNPLNFYLTKVAGIDSGFNNNYTLSLSEILSESNGTLIESVQFNYMFEVDWLMAQYPKCFRECPLLLVAQDKLPTRQELKDETANYKNIQLAFARLMDSFGTHHTKMMFLKYSKSLRVVIHTANLIERDWHQKTQGIWASEMFALKDSVIKDESPTKFRSDLIQYLESYRISALNRWIDILKRTDMSEAKVFLIGSTPGRHKEGSLHKFGHMKVRKILGNLVRPITSMDSVDNYWPVLGQFSSIGTLGAKPDNWLSGEFLLSMKSLPRKLASITPTPLKLIFPCVEDVRNSLEGYEAGGSLPYSMKTHIKQPYLTKYCHKWVSESKGRTRACPHIKSYFRVSPDYDQISWAILTSANLSKAAWGTLEKNATQLCIRSYELGVMFFPQCFGREECFDVSQTLEITGDGDENPITFPVPFDIPPVPYGSKDEPWVWDVPRKLPDSRGQQWMA